VCATQQISETIHLARKTIVFFDFLQMFALGGRDGGDAYNFLSSVLRFEPAANGGLGDWLSAAPMAFKRYDVAAHVVTHSNGEQFLYAVGGRDASSTPLASGERLGPLSGSGLASWTSIANMAQTRRGLP